MKATSGPLKNWNDWGFLDDLAIKKYKEIS